MSPSVSGVKNCKQVVFYYFYAVLTHKSLSQGMGQRLEPVGAHQRLGDGLVLHTWRKVSQTPIGASPKAST